MRIMHMLHELDAEVGQLASTVRLGEKWLSAAPGTDLRLCVCAERCEDGEFCGLSPVERGWTVDMKRGAYNGTPLSCPVCRVEGYGEVVELWRGLFEDVPARLLELEHEERSRVYSGLFDSMTKAYGPEHFKATSFVVIVVYRRTR